MYLVLYKVTTELVTQLLMDGKISLVTSPVKMSHHPHQPDCSLSFPGYYPDFTSYFCILRQSLLVGLIDVLIYRPNVNFETVK